MKVVHLEEGKRWKRTREISAPLFRFVKQEPSRWWHSDGSFLAMTKVWMVTGVSSRYKLTQEQRVRTIRRRKMLHEIV